MTIKEMVGPLIGKTSSPVVFQVEKGAIRKYADAVGDYNPLYWDEQHASSIHGSIIAPFGFFGWPVKWKTTMPFHQDIREVLTSTLNDLGFTRSVDGGIEFEFFIHVYENDIIFCITKISDMFLRKGKSGKLVFSVLESDYFNQNGSLVSVVRHTIISS